MFISFNVIEILQTFKRMSSPRRSWFDSEQSYLDFFFYSVSCFSLWKLRQRIYIRFPIRYFNCGYNTFWAPQCIKPLISPELWNSEYFCNFTTKKTFLFFFRVYLTDTTRGDVLEEIISVALDPDKIFSTLPALTIR